MYSKFGQYIDGKWQPSHKKETYKEYALTLFKANEHEKALRYLNKGSGTIILNNTGISVI